MNKAAWTADDIPDQTGRTYIVTGANSGRAMTRELARRGARRAGRAVYPDAAEQIAALPDEALEGYTNVSSVAGVGAVRRWVFCPGGAGQMVHLGSC